MPTSRFPWRRRSPLAGLTLMVLLFHAWLLAGLPLGLGDEARPRPAPMQVRAIAPVRPVAEPVAATPTPAPRPVAKLPSASPAPPPPEAVVAAAPTPPPEPDAPATATAAEPVPAPAAEAASAPEPTPTVAAAPEPAPTPTAVADVVPVDAAPVQVAAAATDTPASDRGERLPVYPTRVPSAATLQFELKRGLLSGEGTLQWRPTAGGYELEFEGRAFGLSLLGWASRGAIDANGLAPDRYLDRRRGKDVRAANFQRDKGLITYSASTAKHPLQPGAQDRLSFMLQLAAVVDAEPGRFGPGERVAMQVVGARGDAGTWLFEVMGRESLDLPAGPVSNALRLRREPRKAYDTVVEIWLDSARQHLPVRLKLATAGGDDAMEFLLKP